MSTFDYGYIRTPKAIKELELEFSTPIEVDIELEAELDGFKQIGYEVDWKALKKAAEERFGLVQRTFRVFDAYLEKAVTVERWCKMTPFKPSKEQVVKYLKYKQENAKTMAEARQYKVPVIRTREGEKETTGKDELKRICDATGDPVLKLILALRSVQKLLTNDLPNWKPTSDGRVHSTFRFSPPQGQLNASAPNVLNASKHTPLGQEFRGIVVALPGHKIIEFDYSRFHIATMGYLAGDTSYIRFGRLDCHSIFGTHVEGNEPIGLDWSDSDIRLAVKSARAKPEFEHARNEKYKHTILGNQLGLGAFQLHMRHREHIKSKREAQELQKLLARMFLKVETYKRVITKQADSQRFLIDDWGQIRWFYDVFTHKYHKVNASWEAKHGTDYEKALSHLVQSVAFGMIKDKLKQVDIRGGCEEFSFINTVHDSLMFMPEDGQVDECIEMVYGIMTRACERLKGVACPDGLEVGVDVSVGRVWRSKEEREREGMEEIQI